MAGLAQVLEDVAKALQDAPSPHETLEAITHAALDVVGGAQMAAVSMVTDRREVETVAATDDVAKQVDDAQYETEQGPCLEALYETALVRMTDDDSEERWPEFTSRIRDLGVRSMLCVRLFLHGEDAAALNLYARTPDAFDEDDEDVARLLATHAAVALAAARTIEQLQHKASSRDVIGQAKGILMERHDLTADAAFLVLVRGSQDANLKLIEVARRVVARD